MTLPKHFLILLAVCSVLTAQDLREIEFSVYGQYPVRGVEYSPISDSAIAAGEKAEPPKSIESHTLERMGPYSFKGGDRITFVSSTDQAPVARVRIPDNSDKWLLIFVRNPSYRKGLDANLRFLVYPFDDSQKNLPTDQLVFLNISGKELNGLVEDKRMTITVGESDAIRVQQSLPINLWTRDFKGEKLLPALIKTYKFQPNHRYLMIFFPPVLRGSTDLDVRFISEKVDPNN